MKLTILTPTYNRASELSKLYQSLLGQTEPYFEWFIVDDGSLDCTEEVVRQFISEKKMAIQYIKKDNGGKHTALNVGIQGIQTDLTFIVDSDDCLTKDAVAQILYYYEKYQLRSDLCGFSFLRKYQDGRINGKLFVQDELIESYIDCRINRNDTQSDKAEVFYTIRLKEFLFPVFPGEKFVAEDLIWIRMALKYKMVHVNKPIYIGNYLNGGLTSKARLIRIKAPLSEIERGLILMRPECCLKARIKGALMYIVYCKFASKKWTEIVSRFPSPALFPLAYLCGIILYYRWKKNQRLPSS